MDEWGVVMNHYLFDRELGRGVDFCLDCEPGYVTDLEGLPAYYGRFGESVVWRFLPLAVALSLFTKDVQPLDDQLPHRNYK